MCKITKTLEEITKHFEIFTCRLQKAKSRCQNAPVRLQNGDFRLQKTKKYRAVAKNQKSKRNENSDADYKEAEF